MRIAAAIFLILFAHSIFAQQKQVSFAAIDERVKSIEPGTLAELACALTKDYQTDREKLRSIFSWITEHIAYRVRKAPGKITVNNFTGRKVMLDSARWQSANDMVADQVLQSRSAVCDGYARLFKTLCDYAGLRSAIITGFAKGGLSRQLKFHCNHTWNAIYLDSAWRLLDVTWASGYISYGGDEFIKRFDETYFLPAPEDFIQDHFPDDLRWTLMDKPLIPREFNNAPYKSRSFSKYRINAYTPGNGIIEAAIGDTVQVILETGDPVADYKMAADTLVTFDSSQQKIFASVAFVEPCVSDKNKQLLRYVFCVEDANIQWLHIVYNHDTVLRYRLRVKKEKAVLAVNELKEPLHGIFLP